MRQAIDARFGVAKSKVITIAHLLTHTSGIYSFQADSGLRAKPGLKSPGELIAVAQKHGNAFCPGEYCSYCNTGYVMLGQIIERIEGRPFHEVVTSRIVERLATADFSSEVFCVIHGWGA